MSGSTEHPASRLPVDHLVYAVPDLVGAISELEAKLGVRPRMGGKHETLGTWNALLPLGHKIYLELIAADPAAPEPSQARPFGLDDLEHARLTTWAVRSEAIERDVATSRARGFDPGLVIPVSRKEPGGETLEWRLSLRAESAGPGFVGKGLVPFVIDWGTTPHPAEQGPGGCTLVDFRGEHPEPTSIHEFLRALGSALVVSDAGEPGLRATIDGPAGRLELR